MTKKRKRQAPASQALAVDLGPDVRRRRGDVVVEFRPDPDSPATGTVQGAKARVWYHVAWIEGQITDEHHEAADRYLVRLEQHQGAKEGSPTVAAGIRGQGFAGPTERQVMATADLRAADHVLGPDVKLVREVIGWNLTPSPADVPVLRAALQRLAEHWGM